MAEITKLSAGQALDKLRGTDLPESKMALLNGKIEELDEEIQRLRATNRRLDRDQRAGTIRCDFQEAKTGRVTKLKMFGIAMGIVIVIPVLVWMWHSLGVNR